MPFIELKSLIWSKDVNVNSTSITLSWAWGSLRCLEWLLVITVVGCDWNVSFYVPWCLKLSVSGSGGLTTDAGVTVKRQQITISLSDFYHDVFGEAGGRRPHTLMCFIWKGLSLSSVIRRGSRSIFTLIPLSCVRVESCLLWTEGWGPEIGSQQRGTEPPHAR